MTKTDYLRSTHHEFLEASQEALDSPQLQRILVQLGDTLGQRNRDAWSALENSSLIREHARRIKDETLAHLDEHLETLEKSVIARGGQVHYATDSHEACEIITGLIRARGYTQVVKSKSMTTEEIHLNPALEKAGISAVETDLGEYIIQLAGHRPSHIVGPALHLSAKQVAEILSVPAGRELPVEREPLAAFAREALRAKFAAAEVGISGVNFAVAETGTIVLISNEGNARLTTTLPKMHIAIMGMEKVIPRLEHLPIFLKVLARAATGQKLSCYTSLVTGPRRPEENEGPEEFHLVVLDNGRSKILGSPLRESLFCIRCGACLNACPIYRSVGGHSYGGVYAGPIGAVLTPLYDGLRENHHLPQASSLCGACQAACPVKIQIPQMLIQLREELKKEPERKNWIEATAYQIWARMLRTPSIYRFATWLVSRTIGRWYARTRWMKSLPGELRGWTEKRDFPAPASRRFRDWWNQHEHDEPT
ncbi:iron-sulfur cluster binding protein [Pirellula staleyi DSM 6068]|uniref:Iron-sulfur cluster binding protein n=1 Tax=Pirellula staleyi (strain ATCC 27377 / DSM 6068 / ICPB 4128) TaxID=530564 RepID=D2R753_PIRSD|nr:LutB/LldF family L-lactate oxidation iron-sulfur protein [Pirellula staleyi]ADB19256.1 iron-sulfur cluster binding protein [Pirellula staleyi DSM 6068]